MENMEEEIREIIEYGHDLSIESDADVSTIIDRWVSNILALDEVADEASEEAIQNTQEGLAHTASAILMTVIAAPILVPLIVNPLLEDEALRKYINDWAEAVPVKETDKAVTTLDITIERS